MSTTAAPATAGVRATTHAGGVSRLLLSLALAAVVWWVAPDDAMLRTGLTVFALVAALWFTHAFEPTVTAILVPVLCIVTGVFTVGEAVAPFAHPVIFLFLGGFALAAALARHELDLLLAAGVLRLAGGQLGRAVILQFGLTVVLGMWISNTATAALMLPLTLGLLRSSTRRLSSRTYAFVLLGLAYSASIGGIATIVGSPPNAIAAAQAGITFLGWLRIGLPMVALLWPVMLGLLWLLLRPDLSGRIEPLDVRMDWTRGRIQTVVIFVLAVTGWVAGAPLAAALGVSGNIDALVGLTVVVVLGATRTVEWRDIEENTRWGVLLMFGGGLTLSAMMNATGVSQYLAEGFIGLTYGAPVVVLVFAATTFVILLTSVVSNTASAALLVPIYVGIALELGLSPVVMAATAAVAASCSFALPIATPPNALVFGTGLVPAGTMLRAGAILSGLCIIVIGTVAALTI